jgi:hypothetical protein
MANAQQHKHANTIAQIHNSQCWCQNYTSLLEIFRKSENDENIWKKKKQKKKKKERQKFHFSLLFSTVSVLYIHLQTLHTTTSVTCNCQEQSITGKMRLVGLWQWVLTGTAEVIGSHRRRIWRFSRLSFSNCSAASSSCMLLSASISCWFRCV